MPDPVDGPGSFDVIVVGAGPAGLAAAAAVGEAGLRCLSLDAMGPGGQLMNLGRLHDCPDLPEGTTGPDLLGLLVERATAAGVEMGFGEVRRVAAIADGRWRVETDDEAWAAGAVVVATGMTRGTTGLGGEGRYEGRGLSHCANCDGPLYKDQPVVVHGDGAWALTEAIELGGIASEVTLVVAPGGAALAGQAGRRAFAEAQAGVAIVEGRLTGLVGDEALAAVDVETAGGALTLAARALFLLAGRRPATGFLGDLVQRTPGGAIEVGLGDGRTGAAGILAAGDVAGGREHIPDAIADGERAGQNAAHWVRHRRGTA